MRKRTTLSLLEQKRKQYHTTITNPVIQQEMDVLSGVFKELIFLYGVLDHTTERMLVHFITEGIPMLFRPMEVVEKEEKKRYEKLVLRMLRRMRRTLAYQLLEKEEKHHDLLQPLIATLLHKKSEA